MTGETDIKKEAPKKGSTVLSKKEKWNIRFDECVAFKEENGHCKIPTSYKDNKKLGIWVQEQRRNYKLMKQGKKPRVPLTDEQMDKLDGIGFHWGFTPDPFKTAESDESWEVTFANLEVFYKEHGHFDVPLENNTLKLGIWARAQRYQKKQQDSKVKSFMTKARARKLEEIGFDWTGPRTMD